MECTATASVVSCQLCLQKFINRNLLFKVNIYISNENYITLGTLASDNPVDFRFSHRRHRRTPLQAHEVTQSLLSGANIATSSSLVESKSAGIVKYRPLTDRASLSFGRKKNM